MHKKSNLEKSYILPPGERQFSDLYLCYCGYEECRPEYSFGPAVRPNYIIHYILKGKGIYRVREITYELKAGQGFLITPGEQTFYKADSQEPWTYLWIGFDGSHAVRYLFDIGLSENRLIYHSNRGEQLYKTVMDMMAHNTCNTSDQYRIEGLLYTFFSILSEDLNVLSAPGAADGSLYVKKAVEFIQTNYYTPIRITDIADFVCVNRSYLYTLFRRELNLSPQEYLTGYRLTQAAELLLITDLSVESVAFSCGYKDSLVFSKAFKARYGETPSHYRKRKRNKNSSI